jgi:hypothetical protein
MDIVRLEQGRGLTRPSRGERINQPARMSGAARAVLIDPRKERLAFGHEPAQHGIDQAAGARLTHDAHGVNGGMRRLLRHVARVLDLVRRGHQ